MTRCASTYVFPEPAFEPAERPDQERRAVRTLLGRDAVPHRDGRDAAREVLREPVLTGREQRDRAAAGLTEKLVHRRLLRDRKADEGWIERESRQRPERQSERLPVRVDREDAHAGWIARKNCAQIFRLGHRGHPRAGLRGVALEVRGSALRIPVAWTCNRFPTRS